MLQRQPEEAKLGTTALVTGYFILPPEEEVGAFTFPKGTPPMARP